MKPEYNTPEIGDWRKRFEQRAKQGWRRDSRPPKPPLKGGRARKIRRVIDWYGEDWCGLDPPKE